MSLQLITEAEMAAKGVSSLPTRPNSPYAYGGEGLTAAELKARFDCLPRYVAERLNSLLEAVAAIPELSDLSGGSLAESLRTGMFPSTRPTHTLAALCADILDGTFPDYLAVGNRSLTDVLAAKEDATAVVSGSGDSLTLESGKDYRFGEVTQLSLSLPASPGPDFVSMLSFDSGGTNGDTALDYPDGIAWSGDDIIDGAFMVFGSKHYTVLLWYDGAWQGAVRGVSI